MKNLGIIGGSGIYKLDSIEVVKEHTLSTPFGSPSSRVIEAKVKGHKVFFLPRHGIGHTINPSEINYRANIYALKMLGVDTVVSISAVGSLKEEHAPTNFVFPDQFIDWTKGKRARSFFENGIVGHVSCADPINRDLQDLLFNVCNNVKIKCSKGGSYICIEGPQFSTRAESQIYRSFGADVIGMTNVPEAFLAKEAAMAYATVAMVTDYDCWKEEHCTVDEIMKVLEENYKSAQTFIENLIPYLYENPISFEPENKFAIVTNQDLISSFQQEIIDMLQS